MPRLPDVEALVVAFLAEHLDAPVHVTIPNPRPTPLVRVQRTGGPARNRVMDETQVTVQAWGTTGVEAAGLIGEARDLLLNAATRDGITLLRRAEDVSGVYYDPDPDNPDPRYTVTVRLTVRATTAAQA